MVFCPSNWKVAKTAGVPPLNDAGSGVGWGAVYWRGVWSFLGNDSYECFHPWCGADCNRSWEHLNWNKKPPGHSDGLWEGRARKGPPSPTACALSPTRPAQGRVKCYPAATETWVLCFLHSPSYPVMTSLLNRSYHPWRGWWIAKFGNLSSGMVCAEDNFQDDKAGVSVGHGPHPVLFPQSRDSPEIPIGNANDHEKGNSYLSVTNNRVRMSSIGI